MGKAVWAMVALLALGSVLPARAEDAATVKVAQGKLQGQWSSDHQIREFLGIPYAQPPVGALRWRPPVPAKKWHGTREAIAFGAHCVQPALFADMVFRDPGNSENCLTLNVWAPVVAKKHTKLPVMVWIYGGGYITGGTSEPRQDGEHLAHKGVIVVSMNYRLGIFGFFAGSGLAAESPEHAAGNYGLMDQAAALRWVHDNIASFGGDPSQVTIFGESAGSFSVSTQMAAPQSQGLFARAIGESGGAFRRDGLGYKPLAEQEKIDDAFAQKEFGTTDVTKLRALSADALLKAEVDPEGGDNRFGPDVDGYFLSEGVPETFAEGKQAHVPLLAGWNRDEGTAIVLHEPEAPTPDSFGAMAKKQFGDQAADFLKDYAVSDNEDLLRVAEDYSADRFIAYSTWAWLEAQAKTGQAPVYRYYFAEPSPGDPVHPASMGTFHSDDIEYVFGTLDSRRGAHWQPEDYAISEQIQNYWTNFAKTGNPNGAGLPQWPTYDAADHWQVMHLDENSSAQSDAHRDRYLFLQQVWGPKLSVKLSTKLSPKTSTGQ